MAIKSPLSLLSSRLNKPNSAFPHMAHKALLWTLSILSTAYCIVRTKTKHSIPSVAWQALSRVGQWLLYLCWWCHCWCNPVSCGFALLQQHTAHLCCTCSPGPPGPFALSCSLPGRSQYKCCAPGLCYPGCKILLLSLLTIIRFLSGHSSGLSRSSCSVALWKCPVLLSVWFHCQTSSEYTWSHLPDHFWRS